MLRKRTRTSIAKQRFVDRTEVPQIKANTIFVSREVHTTQETMNQ